MNVVYMQNSFANSTNIALEIRSVIKEKHMHGWGPTFITLGYYNY